MIKHIRFSWPWKSAGTTYRLPFITSVIPIALINDAQVLQYDNTKLSFHCHTCLSASAIATEKSNEKLSGQSLAIHGEDIRVERPHITDNILRINSPLRLKPMASLIGDICANLLHQTYPYISMSNTFAVLRFIVKYYINKTLR